MVSKHINPHMSLLSCLNLASSATLHLFYARFIAHFLCKIGLLETKEPFKKLLSQVITKAIKVVLVIH